MLFIYDVCIQSFKMQCVMQGVCIMYSLGALTKWVCRCIFCIIVCTWQCKFLTIFFVNLYTYIKLHAFTAHNWMHVCSGCFAYTAGYNNWDIDIFYIMYVYKIKRGSHYWKNRWNARFCGAIRYQGCCVYRGSDIDVMWSWSYVHWILFISWNKWIDPMLTTCISCVYQDCAHTYILRLFYYINLRIIYTIMRDVCMWFSFSCDAFGRNARALRYICAWSAKLIARRAPTRFRASAVLPSALFFVRVLDRVRSCWPAAAALKQSRGLPGLVQRRGVEWTRTWRYAYRSFSVRYDIVFRMKSKRWVSLLYDELL